MFEKPSVDKAAFVIWIATMWTLWNVRNEKTFENIILTVRKVLEEIKARTWSLLVAKNSKCNNLKFLKWHKILF